MAHATAHFFGPRPLGFAMARHQCDLVYLWISFTSTLLPIGQTQFFAYNLPIIYCAMCMNHLSSTPSFSAVWHQIFKLGNDILFTFIFNTQSTIVSDTIADWLKSSLLPIKIDLTTDNYLARSKLYSCTGSHGLRQVPTQSVYSIHLSDKTQNMNFRKRVTLSGKSRRLWDSHQSN